MGARETTLDHIHTHVYNLKELHESGLHDYQQQPQRHVQPDVDGVSPESVTSVGSDATPPTVHLLLRSHFPAAVWRDLEQLITHKGR